MAIEWILFYLGYIFFVLGYTVATRFRFVRYSPLEPLTFTILAINTLVFGLIVIFKGNSLPIDILRLISVGVGIFAIGIALFAFGRSEESYRGIIKTMRYQFKELKKRDLDLREKLFKDIRQHYANMRRYDEKIREIREKEIPYEKDMDNLMKLINNEMNRFRQNLEFVTWNNYLNFDTANEILELIDKNDQTSLLNGHVIIIKHILREELIGIIKNVHVEHLLMATHKALDFKVIDDFQDKILELFSPYIGDMDKTKEDFSEYLVRKIKQIRKRDLNDIFEKINTNEEQ